MPSEGRKHGWKSWTARFRSNRPEIDSNGNATALNGRTLSSGIPAAARAGTAPNSLLRPKAAGRNPDSIVIPDRRVPSRDESSLALTPTTTSTKAKNDQGSSRPQAATTLYQDEISRSLDPEPSFPRIVLCRLVVFYEKKAFWHFEDIEIWWQNTSKTQYRSIEQLASRILDEQCKKGQADPKRLYREVGRCRLLRIEKVDGDKEEEIEADTRILESENHWRENMRHMIGKFCANYPFVRFRLEIRWEYAGLTIEKVENEEYAATVRRAVSDKLETNWEGGRYLPKKDLQNIFTRSTVHELVETDMSLRDKAALCTRLRQIGRPLERERFKEDIVADCIRLLAACIYAELPLECLWHIMQESRKTDVDIPLDLSDLLKSGTFEDVKRENFISHQCRFRPHEFRYAGGRPQHYKLRKGVVIPVTNRGFIDEGAFGRVFKATIHAHQHSFTADRDLQFAIKQFHAFYSDDDTNPEEEMLRKLARFPHANIVLHIASWVQEGRFYMLFPLARCNLQDYLYEEPPPTLTEKNVLWIIGQLNGLADGVTHIHNLAPSGLGGTTADNLVASGTPTPRRGFHHDLKPQNVLLFGGDRGGTPVFKIGDFGTARLDSIISRSGVQVQSYRRRRNLGDPVYTSPDIAQVGSSGRPADIWSLGCIFLEVLLWTFGLGGEDLKQFQEQRCREPSNAMGNTPAFWFRDPSTATVMLKPSVRKKLQILQEKCQNLGVFNDLVRTTAHMLTLKPWERPNAPTIHKQVDASFNQAQIDLEENPDFYLVPQQDRIEIFGVATDFVRTKSRTASIDDRPVNAPFNGADADELLARGHRRSISVSSQDNKPPLQLSTHNSSPNIYGPLLTPTSKLPVTPTRGPSDGRPRSPSIEITLPDGSPASHIRDQAYLWDRAQDHAFIGTEDSVTREELPIPIVRRSQSRSSSESTLHRVTI